MEKLTFIMPDDKAAQVILTKRGNVYLIRDRKIPGEITIVRADQFYSETTFDTLDEAYDFCREYDPDYMGNYLFGKLEVGETFTTLNAMHNSVITAEAGSTVALDTEAVIPAELTATFKWSYEGEPLDENSSLLEVQSLAENNSGIYNVFVEVIGDHNRRAQCRAEFTVTVAESE